MKLFIKNFIKIGRVATNIRLTISVNDMMSLMLLTFEISEPAFT